MKRINILANVTGDIKDCSKRFIVPGNGSGSGVVTLTRSGQYLLTVSGVSESVAKKSRAYLDAVAEVTKEMVMAYQEENKRYTAMHRGVPKIYPAEHYARILAGMFPKKYVRKSFAFPMPRREDVLECLNYEAACLNCNKMPSDATWTDENKLIESGLETLFQKRLKHWQEACRLFDKIEDALEERANEAYLSEHRQAYGEYESFIVGEEEDVERGLAEKVRSLAVPVDLAIDYDYNRKDKLVNLSVVVKDGLAVPPYEASSSLPSGKISLERKPDSEVNSEKAMSAVSMTYLLAGVAFDVSPNIQYVRLSLYERTKRNALLWAEFDRDRFSQIDVAAVDVIADILGRPSVIMCSRKGDGAELQPMEEEYFNKQVALQVAQADSSHLLKRP